ncbi:hypothetical protein [Brucella thiophenivorans]|uniref:Uncharacterized protein n=1 Tax=Brucella thiophenivorans TaxID=571255 RepID=A0A256FZP1_9HYPH|nr:hypothetical protein [Brucella thiophenivorans]OYR20279.1 hypothetical protein CEV31_1705 [Brucella thiophenivorans]
MSQIFRQKIFWKKTLWWTWKVYEFLCVTIVTLYIAFVFVGLVAHFNDSYVLPNKMVVKRVFDFTLYGRPDLFAADGHTLLARDLDMMCFNDRYIEVYAATGGGLIDGETNLRVSPQYGKDVSGLHRGPFSCNGYYIGWVGASLLFERNQEPSEGPCDWLNFSNPNLKNLAWFEKRRCRSRR